MDSMEEAVIGGLLLKPGMLGTIRTILEPHDFSYRPFSDCFNAMVRLNDLNKPTDVLTLSDEMRRPEYFSPMGLVELTGVMENTPSASNIEHYANEVKKRALTRSVVAAAGDIVLMSNEVKGQDLLDAATSKMIGLAADRKRDTSCHINEAINKVLDNTEAMFNGQVKGITTGLIDLDYMLGGLYGKKLYVLAGRPGMGKTVVGVNLLALAACDAGVPVKIYTMEMGADELAKRMICNLGSIKSDAYRNMQEDDWARLTAGTIRLKDKNIEIDDRGGITLSYLVNSIREHWRRNGQSLYVIDYLQLMTIRGENRVSGIGEITRGLKSLSKEIDSPIVLLSQLNRGLEQRPNKRPLMSDLRESGEIEQDADVIVFIYRDEVYNEDSPDKGIAELIIAKNRDGAQGIVRASAQMQYFRFANLQRA